MSEFNEIIVKLNFGSAYPTLLMGDDDLLLEPGDGIEEYRFPDTEELSNEELSSWVFDHVEVSFDGDLDDPSVFESIQAVGIASFADYNANYDDSRGLVMSDVSVFLKIKTTEDELSADSLDDLFHLLVLIVQKDDIQMQFTEFEDYSAEEVSSIDEEIKHIDVLWEN